MRDLPWQRATRISEIGSRIWRYVTPSARFEDDALITAAALLGWPAEDVTRLGTIHFLLSSEVEQFLTDVPALLRRLTTSSNREEEWSHERLRGPVMWNRTLAMRAAGASPGLWITAPARRVYQTPENQMLVHLLDAIVVLARSTGWENTTGRAELARLIDARMDTAEYWHQSRLLQTVERDPLTPREVMRVRSGRARVRYASVIAAHDRYQSLVKELDREAVREAVERLALVSASEGTLFELLCLFGVIDALNELGWHTSAIRLFQGTLLVRARRADGRSLELRYQAVPTSLTAASIYGQVLLAHGFPSQVPLRPDMVLRWFDISGQERLLLVECKLSETGGVRHAARQALFDLLGYRRAFEPSLSSQAPYGLGLAWGEGLVPEPGSEVLLCTPEHVGSALAAVIA
ncbi:hypothetical protein ACI780_20895 [Geodermatophilus sp. SYSU D00814]